MDTSYENLLVEDRERVRLLTLNRPTRKNAFNVALASDLTHALAAAALDDAVRAVVLTGAGGAFSAGADMQMFFEMGSGAAGDLSPVLQLGTTLRAFGKPLIAVVRGVAVGMGVTLLPYFDLVYAGDDATFATPFTKLGLVPEYGSSYTLPRLIGRQRANELVLRGAPIDAPTAAAWGLVTRVYPAGEVLEKAVAAATEIAGNFPRAVARSRELLRDGEDRSFDAAVAAEMEVLATCYGSDEHMAAVTAFLERRQKRG